MNFRPNVMPVAVAMIALVALPVRADLSSHAGPINPDIAKAANQVSVGLGVLSQDYREYNDGFGYDPTLPHVLDSEKGTITNLGIRYAALLDQFYGQALLGIARGDTTYNGRLLLSPSTPITGTTTNTIIDVLVRFGYGFRTGSSIALVPYVELGDHWWRRDLGQGQVEDYEHLNIGLGGKILWSPTTRLVIEGGLSVGEVVLGTMSADVGTFDLGNKPYFSGYTAIDYRFTDHWHISGSIDYRKWEYGISDTIAAGPYIFWEPHSQTIQTTYLIMGGYSF